MQIFNDSFSSIGYNILNTINNTINNELKLLLYNTYSFFKLY